LAQQLESSFLALYQQSQKTIKQEFDIKTIGQRQLKNTCLSYLGYLPHQQSLAVRQFHDSIDRNMTDTQAALIILCNDAGAHRETALQAFYDKWQADALVVDKWLAIQAAAQTADALDRVKALAQHTAFDIKNPNKVYSLIGAFGARNVAFHDRSGEGYVFLRKIVQQLDSLNPQVAARMINPLTLWQRYDKDRQALMRAQLEILQKSSKLSPDLYEIVTKSLG
jgi:aminopeptidase N